MKLQSLQSVHFAFYFDEVKHNFPHRGNKFKMLKINGSYF